MKNETANVEKTEPVVEESPLQKSIKKNRYSILDVWTLSSTIIVSAVGISIWGLTLIDDTRRNILKIEYDLKEHTATQTILNKALEKSIDDINKDIDALKQAVFVPKYDITKPSNSKNEN